MIAELGTPSRRAALLLHAMAPADREWILGNLPADASDRLRELLRELDELGIPRDAALLKQVVSTAAAREPVLEIGALPYAQDSATPAEAIAAADPERLAAVLRDEPLELVAALLGLRDWTWRDAFLRHTGPVRARQVAERLANAGPATRLGIETERIVLAALLRRLRDLPAGVPPAPPLRALPPAPAASAGVLRRSRLGQVFAPLAKGFGR